MAVPRQTVTKHYEFVGGYPTAETVRRALWRSDH
jgi:hypothetical protein